MGMELEWQLQIMTEVGNAIMENGGLDCEGGGTGEWEKLLEGPTEGGRKDQEGHFGVGGVFCFFGVRQLIVRRLVRRA